MLHVWHIYLQILANNVVNVGNISAPYSIDIVEILYRYSDIYVS